MCLQGDPTLTQTIIFLKSMMRTVRGEGVGLCLQFNVMAEETPGEKGKDHLAVIKLIEDFHTIFEGHSRLPPKRPQDHAISLQPGAKAPNIRPYIYPYYQKNEIEKIVSQMLTVGIIKPSNNPFSSHVLLVK